MRAEGEGALCSGIEPCIGEGLVQAQDAVAGAVVLLGMTPGVDDLGDERGGGGSDLLDPSRETLGRPLFGESAVLLRHVLGHGGMPPEGMRTHIAGDALPKVEELDTTTNISSPTKGREHVMTKSYPVLRAPSDRTHGTIPVARWPITMSRCNHLSNELNACMLCSLVSMTVSQPPLDQMTVCTSIH